MLRSGLTLSCVALLGTGSREGRTGDRGTEASMRMKCRAALFGVILLSVACGAETTIAPSDPSQTTPVTVETFAGTLAVGGSSFYSFTLSRSGNVSVLLHRLQEGGVASAATVTLGLGVPRGTGCTLGALVNVAAGSTPQLSNALDPAVYCVRIADAGNLSGPATFAINIIRP